MNTSTAESLSDTPTALGLNGAELLLDTLLACGVDTVFGYPGGAALPLYDALYQRPAVRHVLVRHEQAAVHAAEGYARCTGRVGVVLVTSGPGMSNTVTGLLDAHSDAIPVLCISGQVATSVIGTQAFQECDAIGLSRTESAQLVEQVLDRIGEALVSGGNVKISRREVKTLRVVGIGCLRGGESCGGIVAQGRESGVAQMPAPAPGAVGWAILPACAEPSSPPRGSTRF